jgi:nondiscriminating glutamyl-tRNA synthetase
MQISHVIRGEEWLPSVPKHLYLYQQLGWKPPKMAHLPLLLNSDKSKLSKRQGDVAVEDYLKKGFLVETLLNFIALLGWHAKGDRELFTLAELEKEFSMKRVTKAGAVFDIEKLRWMNGHYLKKLPLERVIEAARPFFIEEFGELEPEVMREFIDYSRPRAATMLEMPHECKTFREELTYSEEDRAILQEATSQEMFGFWAEELGLQKTWSVEAVNELLKRTYEKFGVKGKKLYFPLRLALFGNGHGPELDKIIKLAGRERCIERLKEASSKK